MAFTYPQDSLDNSNDFSKILGSYWSDVYHDKQLISDFLDALALVARQTRQNYRDLTLSLALAETPLFQTDNIDPEMFFQSKLNSAEVSGLRYGEAGYTYGSGAQYGTAVDRLRYRYPIPHNRISIPLITNRIESPSVVLVDGLDFTVNAEHHYIEFKENPFDNPKIPKTPVYQDGEVVDYYIDLYGLRTKSDDRWLFEQHGFVFGEAIASSEEYRRLLSALYRAAIQGGNSRSVDYLLEAVTGIPLADGHETVEVITEQRGELLIITDARVYRFNSAATPSVAVGDTVKPGQALTDALQIFDLSRGEVPAGLDALYIDRNWVSPVVYNGLVFSNEEVDLVVDTSGDYTKVSFDVGGSPTDAAAFWDEVHARGVAAGQTLAHLLDVRENPTTEPGPASLPATVRPLEFLIQNILRGNTSIVIMRHGLGPGALGLKYTTRLRKVVPPGTALLFVLELPVISETITMDGSGTETDPGYAEDVELRTALEPFEETVDSTTAITEKVRFRAVTGSCQ